jgi:hypothetical protein
MVTYLDLERPGKFETRDDIFLMIEESEKSIETAKNRKQRTVKVRNYNGSTTVVMIDRAESILSKAKQKFANQA